MKHTCDTHHLPSNIDNNDTSTTMSETNAIPVVKTDLDKHLKLIATGKVREIYEIDAETLLFVATDRISGACNTH